jgi:PBP1b-binding outer membrane lipoprotein LpoB
MKKIKFFIFVAFLSFILSGCVGTLALAGTAVSTASTTQEVDEEYDGDLGEYLNDKWKAFDKYIKSKTTEEKKDF